MIHKSKLVARVSVDRLEPVVESALVDWQEEQQ